ncbi:DUF2809 domain-containing protein [Emticicia sp. CRIBPO]|uniref:ribosomal maturation YjgA family protein n=1 Tax=Emticicia sp. CRIBPO TaxID=2683258 RepID=UPI00141368CB|nr:DUF2809 domain-containing protein [Emticicia sp. CRIBPO]NBA85881.1 DUF2809 domain-containing protein [Emticicia sp. CRIBPO]
MFTFRIRYFIIFLLLFLTEAAIAVFIHDAVIRPFFGDFLAVIAVYFFLKSFLDIRDIVLIWSSLGFAYFLELLQYCNFLKFSGLEKYKILVVVLGSSFDWRDMLAYTLGILSVFLFQQRKTWFKKSLTGS